VSYLIFRSRAKAALAASIFLIAIFFHKQFNIAVAVTTGWEVPHQYFLTGWLFFYLGLLALVWSARKEFAEVASLGAGLFVVSIMLVLGSQFAYYYSISTLSRVLMTSDTLADSEIDDLSDKNFPLLDIYYIVLDGYGRDDQIKKYYEFDNTEFLTNLREKGFFVGSNATSNYRMTSDSLQASLNMGYIHETPSRLSVSSSKTAAILKKLGYQYIFIPSGYKITNFSPLADIVFERDSFLLDDFSFFLFDLSVPGFIWNRVFAKDPRWNNLITKGFVSSGNDIERWARHITHSFQLLADIPDLAGPKFTFAHIISPHPPIVFKSDGSLNNNVSMLDFANGGQANPWYSPDLGGQIAHLNRLIQSAVNDIIGKSARPPIIVLQGDHGTFKSRGPSILGKTWKPTKEQVRERMSIFFAIYGPEPLLTNFYDSMSPVNLFRILFNVQFDAKFELLPDRSYWSSNDRQIFMDVTEMHRAEPTDLTTQ
jgi:hypothetical protein